MCIRDRLLASHLCSCSPRVALQVTRPHGQQTPSALHLSVRAHAMIARGRTPFAHSGPQVLGSTPASALGTR
eukprot:2845724-Alexandrium_andersonii.AAC.1